MLVEIFHQLYREHEQLFRNKISRRTEHYRRIDFFHARIEIQRRLVCKHRVLRDAQHLRQFFDVIYHRAVTSGNPFRHARRARRVHYVDRVGVYLPAPDVAKRFVVDTAAYHILIAEYPAAVLIAFNFVCRAFFADDRPRRELSEYQLRAETRHLGVYRHITAPCIYAPEKRSYLPRTFRHEHHHRFAADAFAQQAAADRAALFVQLRKRQLAVFSRKSDLVRHTPCRRLQIFKYVLMMHRCALPCLPCCCCQPCLFCW